MQKPVWDVYFLLLFPYPKSKLGWNSWKQRKLPRSNERISFRKEFKVCTRNNAQKGKKIKQAVRKFGTYVVNQDP